MNSKSCIREDGLPALAGLLASGLAGAQGTFSIEEATIAEHAEGDPGGQVTCKGVVQAYLDRIKAYNGTCTALVTADGKAHPARRRVPCAGASRSHFRRRPSPPRRFLPDLDRYQGLPLEYGRMEPTRFGPERASSSSACASAFRTRARSTPSRR